MSREMEILADIAEQNDTHGDYKDRRANTKGSFWHCRPRKLFFAAARSGQLKRKPTVTLAGRSREERGA